MNRLLILSIIACAGMGFAVFWARTSVEAMPVTPPVATPPTAPLGKATISGAGLVEAKSENIAIGTQVGGIVASVAVTVGATVERGALLFSLDARSAEAEVAVCAADLARLKAQPRPEDLPPAQARVAELKAAHAEARDQLDRALATGTTGVFSADEISRRRFTAEAAKARLDAAQAELARLQAGAWSADLAQAEARLMQARTALELTSVRAPIAGTVLAVNVRPGEAIAAAPAGSRPLILLGDVSSLHVRIDIDENDAGRLRDGAAATCSPRGEPGRRIRLAFVRREPWVIPKRQLTGDATERVDTRVLQLIYRVADAEARLMVGQQVDAFIER